MADIPRTPNNQPIESNPTQLASLRGRSGSTTESNLVMPKNTELPPPTPTPAPNQPTTPETQIPTPPAAQTPTTPPATEPVQPPPTITETLNQTPPPPKPTRPSNTPAANLYRQTAAQGEEIDSPTAFQATETFKKIHGQNQ